MVIAPTIPVILFSHVIDGVAYSFFAVALVLFIGEVAPDRQVTMMMAIFTVTLPSIVRMVSAPVGGWVFDVRGAYALYVIGVIGSAVGWLIMKVMVKDRRVEGRQPIRISATLVAQHNRARSPSQRMYDLGPASIDREQAKDFRAGYSPNDVCGLFHIQFLPQSLLRCQALSHR